MLLPVLIRTIKCKYKNLNKDDNSKLTWKARQKGCKLGQQNRGILCLKNEGPSNKDVRISKNKIFVILKEEEYWIGKSWKNKKRCCSN
jgi:hypothetical protein